MKEMLAFLATAAVATSSAEATSCEKPPASDLPKFGRRWHSLSRLDLRPVLWSLKNRPEEWYRNEYSLIHEPSKHEFWIGNGFFFYKLYEANCSCTRVRRGSFSLIQKMQFAWVYSRWRRSYDRGRVAEINQHFSEHFITPRATR